MTATKDVEAGIRFDRNDYPYTPHGARKKGDTIFHRRLRLWRNANKAIGKFEAKSHSLFNRDQRPDEVDESIRGLWEEVMDAIQEFEAYCQAMDAWYSMLGEAAEFASEALEEALLDFNSGEGQKLYNNAKRQYVIGHHVEFPK